MLHKLKKMLCSATVNPVTLTADCIDKTRKSCTQGNNPRNIGTDALTVTVTFIDEVSREARAQRDVLVVVIEVVREQYTMETAAKEIWQPKTLSVRVRIWLSMFLNITVRKKPEKANLVQNVAVLILKSSSGFTDHGFIH